nr:unnamed protein product [Callosobruchus analis]
MDQEPCTSMVIHFVLWLLKSNSWYCCLSVVVYHFNYLGNQIIHIITTTFEKLGKVLVLPAQQVDYCTFNKDNFDEDIRILNWQDIIHTNGIDKKVDILTSYLLHLLDQHAPIKKVRVTKPKVPWLTNEALSRFKSTRSIDDWEQYKNYEMVLQPIWGKQNSIILISQSGSAKDTWNALSKLNVHSKIRSASIPESLSNPEAINTFFIISVQKLNCGPDPNLVTRYNNTKVSNEIECNLKVVPESNVLDASIKPNSAGPDAIALNSTIMQSICVTISNTHL